MFILILVYIYKLWSNFQIIICDLTYNKKKLYFPAKELTAKEREAVRQKVYQSGKEYIVKNGQVYLEDKIVSNFEGYFHLNNRYLRKN